MSPGWTEIKWWAWVDLNHRPRPYRRSVVRIYSDLQDRGGCQTARKFYKTAHSVGWVVGWKKLMSLLRPANALRLVKTVRAHAFPIRVTWRAFAAGPSLRNRSGCFC